MKTKFTPNLEQEKAFKKVENAIKEAKRKGLVFYGKSDTLVAYTKEADAYIDSDFIASLRGRGSAVPYIGKMGLISDSGADDYGRFLTTEDENKYT